MVDSVVTKQELIDAQKDAQSLEDVINGPADTRVKPRIGPEMWTLATINSLVQQGQIKISDLSEAIQTALAAGAGSAGWTANLVADGNQTQKEINLYGGKKYDMPVGGYPLNARIMLDDGDIVKSTVPNNIINPNVDMTGWVNFEADQKDVNQYLFPFYSLKKFGAVGDGVTDDRQAFQDALDYLSSGGGGTLTVPDGEYLLNSKTNKTGVNVDTLVSLRPNVSIVGLGPQSKIKVGSFPNKQFYCLYNYTENLGNISVSNLFIDANGQGNLPESNHGYLQWIIATAIANQVQIDAVHVINAGGQQVFGIGSNEETPTVNSAMVTRCRVYKTGQDITGNIQGDHSSFYIAAKSAIITGNTLSNDNENLTSTAIECHSHNQVVTGNNILNFNVGIITAATVRSLNSALIANNNIKARKAWHLWVQPNFDIHSIIFSQNNCTFATLDGAGFLDITTQVKTPMTGSLLIEGNNIIGDKREISSEGFYGVYVGDIENIAIKNNNFQGVIGRPIEFGAITSVGKVSIDIEGNTFNECNSTTNTLYKECIAFNTLTSIKRLSIKRNTCVSSSSAYSNRVVNGSALVGLFEFEGNTERGSGFTSVLNWSSGKLAESRIDHKTRIEGKPTIDASPSSQWKVIAPTGFALREYVRRIGVSPVSQWNTIHYVNNAAPTGIASLQGDRALNNQPVAGRPAEWICTLAGTPGTWIPVGYLGTPTTTTAAIQSQANAINTTDKFVGKQVINSTDGKIYYTAGALATDVWKTLDGVTTITPA